MQQQQQQGQQRSLSFTLPTRGATSPLPSPIAAPGSRHATSVSAAAAAAAAAAAHRGVLSHGSSRAHNGASSTSLTDHVPLRPTTSVQSSSSTHSVSNLGNLRAASSVRLSCSFGQQHMQAMLMQQHKRPEQARPPLREGHAGAPQVGGS